MVRDITAELQMQQPGWSVDAVSAFSGAGWLEGLDGFSDVIAALRIGWRVARSKHDVVFVHCPECVWGVRLLARLGTRKPLVVVWHGAGPQPYLVLRSSGHPLARGLAWFRCLEERRALKADAQIAVHAVIERDLRDIYGFRGPVLVIENALGRETLTTLNRVVPLSRDQPMTAVWVGQAGHRKGLDVALAAVHEARREIPELRLLVAGVPAGAPQDGVEWLGVVPPGRIAEVYSRAHVLLFPTRYESFGLVVIEGMAAGLAIVTSDAVPEGIVESGRNGTVVLGHNPHEYARALVELARDPIRREQIGSDNRDEAHRFSVESAGSSYAAAASMLRSERSADHAQDR